MSLLPTPSYFPISSLSDYVLFGELRTEEDYNNSIIHTPTVSFQLSQHYKELLRKAIGCRSVTFPIRLKLTFERKNYGYYISKVDLVEESHGPAHDPAE